MGYLQIYGYEDEKLRINLIYSDILFTFYKQSLPEDQGAKTKPLETRLGSHMLLIPGLQSRGT